MHYQIINNLRNMKKYALLGIDLQNDFVLPTGALSVPNAMEDADRIAAFIRNNSDKIKHISLTLDSHYPIHIAHPSYWKDKNGNQPALFTNITLADVKNGTWVAQYDPMGALRYLEELEKNGSKHTIWPPHCILGSDGWAIVKQVKEAVDEWCLNNATFYNLCFKGEHPSTEHYSIFKAAVVIPNQRGTNFNHDLIRILSVYDEIIIFGEAATHCVRQSLNDILEVVPDLAKKLTVLTDCMSPIGTIDYDTDEVYVKAKNMGVKFVKSTDIIL